MNQNEIQDNPINTNKQDSDNQKEMIKHSEVLQEIDQSINQPPQPQKLPSDLNFQLDNKNNDQILLESQEQIQNSGKEQADSKIDNQSVQKENDNQFGNEQKHDLQDRSQIQSQIHVIDRLIDEPEKKNSFQISVDFNQQVDLITQREQELLKQLNDSNEIKENLQKQVDELRNLLEKKEYDLEGRIVNIQNQDQQIFSLMKENQELKLENALIRNKMNSCEQSLNLYKENFREIKIVMQFTEKLRAIDLDNLIETDFYQTSDQLEIKILRVVQELLLKQREKYEKNMYIQIEKSDQNQIYIFSNEAILPDQYYRGYTDLIIQFEGLISTFNKQCGKLLSHKEYLKLIRAAQVREDWKPFLEAFDNYCVVKSNLLVESIDLQTILKQLEVLIQITNATFQIISENLIRVLENKSEMRNDFNRMMVENKLKISLLQDIQRSNIDVISQQN